MIDWLAKNSSWISALGAITSVIFTLSLLIRWVLLRIRQQKHESDVTLKPSTVHNPDLSLGKFFQVNVQLLKIFACVCGAIFIIFFFIMINRDAQQSNLKIRLYTKQVKEAYLALESTNLELFQKKSSLINPEIEATIEQRISMATGSSKDKLKRIIKDYQYIKNVYYKSLNSNIFLVSNSREASLYSAYKEKNKIVRVFSYKYGTYGYIKSPNNKKFGFYIKEGIFSKITKFYIINMDGKYLKRIYTIDSSGEILRWESDNVLIITDNKSEIKIVLTDENNPR